MLVVCGSATSWMSNRLINDKGGLYGRLTDVIKLEPFTLSECAQFYEANGINLSRYDITEGYMILGGIPYYMDYFAKGFSLAQNIDNLFQEKCQIKRRVRQTVSLCLHQPGNEDENRASLGNLP